MQHNKPPLTAPLQVLSTCGVASRRASALLVSSGKVKVNGLLITDPGTKVDASKDVILVNDEPLDIGPQKQYYFAVFKPTGYICSNVSSKPGRRAVDLLEPWLKTWKEAPENKVTAQKCCH
eukprot:jgi/Chrzof1/12792/Cz07g07220.t1